MLSAIKQTAKYVTVKSGFLTIRDCHKAVNDGQIKDRDGTSILWKRRKPDCGSFKTNRLFWCCASHKDCPVQLKAGRDHETNGFVLQRLAGVLHAGQKSKAPRQNGIMTQAQKERVVQMVDAGAMPCAIFGALTKMELKRCKDARIKAKKRNEGGLVGE